MMRFKSVFLAFLLLGLLTVTGCSDANDTNGDAENDSADALTEPPGLTVHAGEESVRAELGTYSWRIAHEDGTETAIEADSAAPPELVKLGEPLAVSSDAAVELDFEEEPQSYTVRIWNEENTVLSESDEVELSGQGTVIYEVLANWEEGKASYAFSLTID